MPKNKSQTKEEKELLEMAAEQFACLFWKQWIYTKEKKKINKTLENEIIKSEKTRFSLRK